VVSDERYHDRKDVWNDIRYRVDFEIMFLNVPMKEENKRNLCAAYNDAAKIAVQEGTTTFISLQDYMYIEPDGLGRFVEFCENNRNDLITGVTHISRDPFPNKVVDLEGKYTIFSEPYTDKPKRMSWEDVRVTEIYKNRETNIFPVELGHWEANWAAVPVPLLSKGIRWDEEYDKGIAYENMDFARRCNKCFKSEVYLDKNNVAISLPHKDYFEGEREEIERYSNRELYDHDWN